MIRSAVALLLVLAPFAARAQDPAQEVDTASGRQIRYQDRQVLTEDDFAGLELEGELAKPGITPIQELRRLKFKSFVALRTDFVPEMAQAVDEVK